MKKIEITTESTQNAASEAILEYPGWALVRILNESENIIFAVENQVGDMAALRIHRPNYQTSSSIISELQWMEFLSGKGIKTPVPIKTGVGKFIASTSNKLKATMVSWIEGDPLQSLHENIPDTSTEIAEIYFHLGGLIAQIHNATDSFEIPEGFNRSRWDIEGFLGDEPLWGRFWDNPVLSLEERTFLLDLRAKLKTVLHRYLDGGGDFGLIHADVISENVLVANGKPTIIDYDDSGFGFRMYDLAVPLYRFYPSEAFAKLAALLKEGYTDYRPLPGKSWELILTFILLRRLALLGWVVPRKPPEEIAIRTRNNLRSIEALVKEINLN